MRDRQPIAIVIENLHCADLASLWLLEFLSQRLCELPIFLVGTFSSQAIYDDALRLPSIARLLRANAALSFELCEFSPPEAAELLSTVCSGPLDAEVAREAHRLTAGNPFLLTQLAPLLSAAAPCSELTTLLPTAIQMVVKYDLDLLDSDTRTVLAAAALLGDRIDARQLSRELQRPCPAVLDQLDAAARLGVLQRISGKPACFAFAHELVRSWLVRGSDTARGDEPPSERRTRAATPVATVASDDRVRQRTG